jgi:putative methyltransferase (TIGR04325 family)
MTLRLLIKRLLPPIILDAIRAARRRTSRPGYRLVYAPLGWSAVLPRSAASLYESARVIDSERENWAPVLSRARSGTLPLASTDDGTDPVTVGGDHNAYMTFAYVAALAARNRSSVKILDYGGNLGYFKSLAKALLPDVEIDYHCKELPAMVRAGREQHTDISWHVDDSCLDDTYDLVMISGSLQYIPTWRELLARASRASRGYVYVTALAVVAGAPSYVAIQHYLGATMHYAVINQDELASAFRDANLRLLREFWVGEHTPIENGAPEQPVYFGALLQPLEPSTSAPANGSPNA